MTIPRVSFAGVISWVPLASFLVLMLFAGVAWREVGHWPYYARPDPKDLGLPLFHALALFAIPVGLLSGFVGVIALIGAQERWRKWHVGIFAVGFVLWAVNLRQTGHLLNWLLD